MTFTLRGAALSITSADILRATRDVPPTPRDGRNKYSKGDRDNGEVLRLLVVFEVDEDGWQVASCPTLPGCHSQGRTREEALDNVREAIRGYLASLPEHDAALPPSSEFQTIEVRA